MNAEATVKLIWNEKGSGEERTIALRVTFNRIGKPFSAGGKTKIAKADFENRNLKITKIAIAEVMPMYNKAVEIAQNLGQEFSFDEFRRQYKSTVFSGIGKDKIPTDIAYLYGRFFNDRPKIKSSTKESYKSGLNWILKYNPHAHLGDITASFLRDLETFINEEHSKGYQERFGEEHNLSKTTIAMYYRGLRAVYNYATTSLKVSVRGEYPFGKGGYMIQESKNQKRAMKIS